MSATGYSARQISLHWIIAILILVQFVLHEGIVKVVDAARDGAPLTPTLASQSHVVIGILILLLALPRLYLRLTRGVPAAPADEPAIGRFLASATHWVLYAVIILMPISGMAAWFGGIKPAGLAHNAGKAAMVAFVALHLAGVVYQRFWLKSDVPQRMMKAER